MWSILCISHWSGQQHMHSLSSFPDFEEDRVYANYFPIIPTNAYNTLANHNYTILSQSCWEHLLTFSGWQEPFAMVNDVSGNLPVMLCTDLHNLKHSTHLITSRTFVNNAAKAQFQAQLQCNWPRETHKPSISQLSWNHIGHVCQHF